MSRSLGCRLCTVALSLALLACFDGDGETDTVFGFDRVLGPGD